MPAVTRRQYAGAAVATTTVGNLAAGGTSVSITAATGWPSTAGVGFFVVISPGTSIEEKCLATISGTTLTLTRAQDGTTAQTHPAGSNIYPVFSRQDADDANRFLSTLTTRGDLLTMGSGPDPARIAVGSANTVLKSNGTDPSWGLVVTANITDANVTTAKIADSNVTTAKIADSNVTTAKIADGNVTAAKLAATAAIQPTIVDAKGDLIVATAADTVARVAVGTNGHVLTADSAETPGVKWAAVPASGLTLISSTTIGSAVSSVTVSDVFSSTYDNYKVLISGGVGSASTIELRLTFGATATGYYYGTHTIAFSTGTASVSAGNNTTFMLCGGASTTSINSEMEIISPNLAEQTFVYSRSMWNDSTGWQNGYLNNTTAYTAFTITTSTGTLTGGTIKVYGYKN